jgi:hypothetical protein
VSRGQRGGSLMAVHLSFLDRSRYFFFKIAPHLSSRGSVDPVLDTLLAPEIEPGTSGLSARNSDH